jgi:sigma-B regulation protein RsbU (phosphoserine phosphatase)
MYPRERRSESKLFKRTAYAFLFAYIGITFTYQVIGSVSLIDTYFDLHGHAQEPFNLSFETRAITGTSSAAKRAGLAVGDQLEAINGAPYTGRSQWQQTAWYAHPGDVLHLDVVRADGARKTIAVRFEGQLHSVRVGEAIFLIFIQVVVPLFCLALGYWVALARPLDPNAWFMLVLLSYPEASTSNSTSVWWPGIWLGLRLSWHLIVEVLSPLALLWLGLLFPERSRIDIRFAWLKWGISAIVACGLGVALLTDYSVWYDLSLLPNRVPIEASNDTILKWIFILCVILYWIAIFYKLRTASTPDARRRLRLLCTGSVIGLGSMLIIFGTLPWFGIADPGSIRWLDILAAILMLVFPLTLAYVVIVQRAMDVRILVRMGTKYAAAKTTLVVIELCVALVILVYFISPAIHATHHGTLDYTISALAIGGLIWLFVARGNVSARLQNWLDRKFFREAYNAELVLSELAERVRSITDVSKLLDTVSQRISEVLHVPQIAVLLRTGGIYQLRHAIGLTFDGPFGIGEAQVREIESSSSAAVVYGEENSPILIESNGASHDIRNALDTQVILPLPGRSELMGLMMLGPKLSQEPYSTSDLRLLESVGVQTGLGLEVSHLAHSLAEEAAQRERIQREIEIAREVQQRLFPQRIPATPGIDLAGHCRPAFEVGGDYYDVFKLDDGRVALAIGDVSGKGISAALLMAGLRASLRSIADDNSCDLARAMTKLNRHVYEGSTSNRYATFFFAVYAPSTGELRYVNAGHNPPVIIREGCPPLLLEAGGTVIGLLKECAYLETAIQLHGGDVFLAYTDGVSEAMDSSDEEWGVERMITAARITRQESAIKVLQNVMNRADNFTQEAPQHDDMTLLVMKVLQSRAGLY